VSSKPHEVSARLLGLGRGCLCCPLLVAVGEAPVVCDVLCLCCSVMCPGVFSLVTGRGGPVPHRRRPPGPGPRPTPSSRIVLAQAEVGVVLSDVTWTLLAPKALIIGESYLYMMDK